MRVYAIVAAAGQGTRLGASVPKAFVPLRGRSLLERSVVAMATAGVVDEVIVLVAPEMEAHARALLKSTAIDLPLRFVHGGGERADSVWAGLSALPASEEAVVLIHDAARALTPPGMIARVARAALGSAQAVIPVVPVADTIKVVDEPGKLVESTPDRARLRAVQTPQGFKLSALRAANEAYFSAGEQAGFIATDDASLMEWFGAQVTCVQGDVMAFKITTPLDLTLAEAITADAEPTIFEVPSI